MNYFQQKLNQILKERKISQTKLSKLADIPQTTISKWLTKNSNPSSINVEKLAKALGMSVGELIGDFGNDINLTETDKRFLALPEKDKEFLLLLFEQCQTYFKA